MESVLVIPFLYEEDDEFDEYALNHLKPYVTDCISFLKKEGYQIPAYINDGIKEDSCWFIEAIKDETRYFFTIVYFPVPQAQSRTDLALFSSIIFLKKGRILRYRSFDIITS